MLKRLSVALAALPAVSASTGGGDCPGVLLPPRFDLTGKIALERL